MTMGAMSPRASKERMRGVGGTATNAFLSYFNVPRRPWTTEAASTIAATTLTVPRIANQTPRVVSNHVAKIGAVIEAEVVGPWGIVLCAPPFVVAATTEAPETVDTPTQPGRRRKATAQLRSWIRHVVIASVFRVRSELE